MNGLHCTHCAKPIVKKVSQGTIRPFCDSTCYGKWQRGASFPEQGKPTRPKRRCSVAGCNSDHFGRGYCRRHYISLHYSPPKPKTAKATSFRCLQCGSQFIAHHDRPRYCSIPCAAAHRKKPFILKKGYKKILMPTHPRADTKGYVFEHIIIVEAALSRALKPKEEVHHKDFNRQNNAPDNLVVCANHAEHMTYHDTPSKVKL